MKRKMRAFLMAIVLCVTFLFACVGCGANKSSGGGTSSKLTINVPDTAISATMGKFELPEYYVVDDEWNVYSEYTVSVSQVVDPDGEAVQVDGNEFRATKEGVYKITYSATGTDVKKVNDAVLEVDFFIPEDSVFVSLGETAANVDKYGSVAIAYKAAGTEGAYIKDGENGALKAYIATDSNYYIRFRQPETTDISMYNYLKFSVYNDSDCKVQIWFMYGGFTILQPNAWTDVVIDLSKYDSTTLRTEGLWEGVDPADGRVWKPCRFTGSNWSDTTNENVFENMSGSFIWIKKHESVSNDADGSISLYFSTIYATME